MCLAPCLSHSRTPGGWVDVNHSLTPQGELAATAVNAPMVSAEVLAELQPYVTLAQGLGTAAVQLVGSHGFADVYITYASPRGGARFNLGPSPWRPLRLTPGAGCHAPCVPQPEAHTAEYSGDCARSDGPPAADP